VTADAPPARRLAVISANSAWNIANFRKPIVEALLTSGWRVVALAPADGYEAQILALGAEFVPIAMDAGGTSVRKDGRLFFEYVTILHRLRPQAFLGFTAKPNIYGSLAARLLGTQIVNNISGLGTAFMRPGPLNWLVTALYRLALHKSSTVFFQNRHDRDLFLRRGLVTSSQARLLPGSGVDLDHFKPEPLDKPPNAPFRFLFVGRLLRDKGLVEYAEAARILRSNWPDVEFAVLGSAASRNPTAVPIAEIERWQREELVNWLGETKDVRPYLAAADCVVLPSYREGLPRSLLEAAAMARPLIASDVPGCSDVIDHASNGLLCEVQSAPSLAAAMEAMLRMSPDERRRMGTRARDKAERQFDQSLVAQAYLEALE